MDDLCVHKKAPALVGLSRREVAGGLMRNALATPPQQILEQVEGKRREVIHIEKVSVEVH